MDDIVFVGDATGRIVYNNVAASVKLQYSARKLRGMNLPDVHPADRHAEASEILAGIAVGTTGMCTVPLQTKDGVTIPVETRVWHGQWDGQDCIFGSSHDLSIRKEAIEKFDRLFRNSPVLMALSDAQTRRFTDINNTFCETLRYAREDVLGHTAKELGLFADPDQFEVLGAALNASDRVRDREVRLKTHDGKMLDGLFSGEVIRSNGTTMFLTVVTNITRQKQAEASAHRARETAEAASKAKGQFLANMSHAIRTPLNGVIGFAGLLADTVLTDLQRQYVDNAITSANALSGITSDILDFSKIEASRLELDVITVDIVERVEQSIDIVKYPAGKKNLEVQLSLDPSTPRYAAVDPIRLKQILGNLLGYAV